MNRPDTIDANYKKAFNLGYELAKELVLNSPMFKNKNATNSPSNAMQAGMMQYIDEVGSVLNKNLSKSVNLGKIKSNLSLKIKGWKTGKDLTP